MPIDIAHPHVLTREQFNNWFGVENTLDYKGGTITEHFHGADCCYGVWQKKY